MDRKRQSRHQRPILSGKKAISLNIPRSMTENRNMPKDTEKTSHRVVLVKGEDQWRFVWESGQEVATVEAITAIAKSPDTDFDWFDAAMVCHEISKIASKAA
jgi:hypothetical protein